MNVAERLAAVRARIAVAARRAGRAPEDVTLVGVSKKQPAAAIVEAAHEGLAAIGENYIQEARDKFAEVEASLAQSGVAFPRRHFIGQLQRNKAKDAAALFDVVETVDRESLGAALARRAERPLEVLLQVNLSGEAQKGGVAPEALAGLLEASAGWSPLRVTGLMTVPAASADPEASRPAFAHLRELRDDLGLRELSMGMSADFEVAIEEGATLVRVGTAIFGPRGG